MAGIKKVRFPEQLPRLSGLKHDAKTDGSSVSGVSRVLSDHRSPCGDVHLKGCQASVSRLDLKDVCPSQTPRSVQDKATLNTMKSAVLFLIQSFSLTNQSSITAERLTTPRPSPPSLRLVASPCVYVCAHAWRRLLFAVTFNLLKGSETTFSKSLSGVGAQFRVAL